MMNVLGIKIDRVLIVACVGLIWINVSLGQIEMVSTNSSGNYSTFPIDHIYFSNDNPQNAEGATRIAVDSTSIFSIINESKHQFVDGSGNLIGTGASGIRLKSEYLEIMSADIVPDIGQIYVAPPWDFEKIIGVSYSGMSIAETKEVTRSESGVAKDMLSIAHGRVQYNSNTIVTGSTNYSISRTVSGVDINFTSLDVDDLVITVTPYTYINDNQATVLVTQAAIEKTGQSKVRIHLYDLFGMPHPEAEFSFVVYEP